MRLLTRYPNIFKISALFILLGYALAVTGILISPTNTQQWLAVTASILEKTGFSLIIGSISFAIFKIVAEEQQLDYKQYQFVGDRKNKISASKMLQTCKLAEDQLVIMAITLDKLLPDLTNTFVKLVQQGVTVKIFLAHPNSPHVIASQKAKGYDKEYHKEQYDNLQKQAEILAQNFYKKKNLWRTFAGSIVIRLYKHSPQYSYIRADRKAYISIYPRFHEAERAPIFYIDPEHELFKEELVKLDENTPSSKNIWTWIEFRNKKLVKKSFPKLNKHY